LLTKGARVRVAFACCVVGACCVVLADASGLGCGDESDGGVEGPLFELLLGLVDVVEGVIAVVEHGQRLDEVVDVVSVVLMDGAAQRAAGSRP
jgi:hypothetical protein